MIKLEITDPHLLDRKALQETAIYLMSLAGGKLLIPEQPKSNNVDKELENDEPIIQEEWIRVPSEVMTLDDFEREKQTHPIVPHDEFVSPPAAEIFKPASSIPVPVISSVELDIRGIPWDMRIHASTKTKMKDGSWKKLRGIDPVTVEQVEAELKMVQNIPVPPSIPTPPTTEKAPDFTAFMSLITGAITAGKLKRDEVTAVLKPYGLPSIAVVSTRPDLIPAIMVSINEVINAPR